MVSNKNFFIEKTILSPKIYGYSDPSPQLEGLIKIGYTGTGDVKKRIKQQYPTLRPGNEPYKILIEETAVRNDGSTFTDRDVHKFLRAKGIENPKGEWFRCSELVVRVAIQFIYDGKTGELGRDLNFKMRPEQKDAVNMTFDYFHSFHKNNKDKTPRFLWNAKMRFGKTFAAYQLALKSKWKKILVLTYKPAVQNAWEEDLTRHKDFQDWQFVSNDGLGFKQIKKNKPFVCFGSFQDYLGKNKSGGIKPKNEWIHIINWDCIIIDEYHFGAWRDKAQDLFETDDSSEVNYQSDKNLKDYDYKNLPVTTNHFLILSGTPFRALDSGEFLENQIYNWTYTDEQKAKLTWTKKDNPYASLPRMILMTYKVPDSIKEIALEGEFDEFDLNEFFSAKGVDKEATFNHKNEVQKWLDLIRGAHLETTKDNLKLGAKKPSFPFSDTKLLSLLNHTFWFLPNVASCFAMRNLIMEKHNTFYHDYNVVVAAGNKAGLGVKALPPVKAAMGNPLKSKTITLSCIKLTQGVTVKPWSGIFVLRNTSSPETYFQSAFRVQSPWEINNPDGLSPNKTEIMKHNCYVFDFAPNRALHLISDYSCRLSISETKNPEQKVQEFIQFLPVLAYDGYDMREVSAGEVLEIAMSGESATMLARRWDAAALVNVDNFTLERLMNNDKAMQALMKIEGFRTLNEDINTIINNTESIKKMKEKANNKDLTKKEKKELSDKEKEYRSRRKLIQDKLRKFATRIPVFMYLTDYRERKLKDIIMKLEPGLFKKVTGLDVQDFELLLSLGVFNSSLMNDAIFKFKVTEDASLNYSGIDNNDDKYGLFDTVVRK
jgi:hypothetical protein